MQKWALLSGHLIWDLIESPQAGLKPGLGFVMFATSSGDLQTRVRLIQKVSLRKLICNGD